MKTDKIIKELSEYLPSLLISELQISLAVKGSIGICMTINDIVKTYNDTQENENKVSELLSELCHYHFLVSYKFPSKSV